MSYYCSMMFYVIGMNCIAVHGKRLSTGVHLDLCNFLCLGTTAPKCDWLQGF